MFLVEYMFQCPRCKTVEVVWIQPDLQSFSSQCPKCNAVEQIRQKPIYAWQMRN